ncbi:hypothetical protein [Streptomyces meridianus]|uniref:HK97 gp10 family phage protein n=1 Tax=Streptomyces meridianus TaxID=2938945 RepID=A0ABT0X3P0_9ACTN|nr:hypothetical protein [Streptomyces meridianus]MCM2576845.1 hypothetical protein [Streptomyces meridianus]
MPTFDTTPAFNRAFKKLPRQQQERFESVIRERFFPDLKAGQFRPGLRVKPVQGAKAEDGSSIFEMTWAPDGRATWQYGKERKPGHPHVFWRNIGTHKAIDPGPP